MAFQSLGEIQKVLQSVPVVPLRLLHEVWEAREPVTSVKGRYSDLSARARGQVPWLQSDVSLAERFTRCALEAEDYLLVCDAFSEAYTFWRETPGVEAAALAGLSASYASAQTRLGQTADALHQLHPWSEDKRLTPAKRARVLLQLGDILREQSDLESTPIARLQSGQHALNYYRKALDLIPSSLVANVRCAEMALRIGDDNDAQVLQAHKWAHEGLRLASEQANVSELTFDLCRNKAVALVVLGRLEQAAHEYARLQSLEGATTTKLAHARYDSELLAIAMGEARSFFRKSFPPLQLIVFAGHMPDLEGAPARFPKDSIPEVRRALRAKLDELDATTALVSAAAGADLLFIEAFLERPRPQLHILMPWSTEEFFRTSVAPFDSSSNSLQWRQIFERALEAASTVRQMSQLYEPGDELGWQFAQEVSAGIALQTAKHSRLDIQPLALWDGQSGRGPGGTASFVHLWTTQRLNTPPIIIGMPDVRTKPLAIQSMRCERSERRVLRQEVKTMLFADVIGYSKFTEKAIHEYVEIFLRKLSKLISESPYSPSSVDMWGDAIFGVFDFARDAGQFALQLTKFVRDAAGEWIRHGLYYEEADFRTGLNSKVPLNLRVGLHTGPVLAHYNHVMRRLNYTGSHVTRAARIEPVATAGEVYVSEEFAAMIALEFGGNARESGAIGGGFACNYAGTMSLAKGYDGVFRIYRLTEERNLPIEELAAAAHSRYCAEQTIAGGMTSDPRSLVRWEELAEDLRQANRYQVADIPFKLRLIGYELAAGSSEEAQKIDFNTEDIELLARQEHERWMTERARAGWRHSSERDNARKLHPSMVAWEALSEVEKEKDRNVIRNLPDLIQKAGLRLKRQNGMSAIKGNAGPV
jgi:class 3 adenylate cyclase